MNDINTLHTEKQMLSFVKVSKLNYPVILDSGACKVYLAAKTVSDNIVSQNTHSLRPVELKME